MILGVTPLGILSAPPKFVPWRDAACIAFFLASAAQTTTPASGSPSLTRATTVPSLRNPAQTLVVPASFQGPKIDTSIGGKATWVADTLLTTLQNQSVVIPAINATGASVFEWFVGRFDASTTGFNTLTCIGSANDPGVSAGFGGSNIKSTVGGVARTITSGAGYVQGTAKRIVVYRSGADVADYIQWGSLNSGAGGTSSTTADVGLALFNRGNTSAPAVGAIGVYGLFTATGANAAARTAAAAALVAKLDAWAATAAVYGSTAWAALVS
jgi:hypothetical protein